MAPLETSTQRLPAARSAATCPAQRAMAAASRPRPSLVTSEEPTLMTSVCAPAMESGCMAHAALGRLRQQAERARAQLPAALAADRRDHEPGLLPAQRAHDALRARRGLGG